MESQNWQTGRSRDERSDRPHGGETGIDSILLATTIATPFRLRGQFEQKFASRGSVYVRHYSLERDGFDGPITIAIGDRQVRHRQGVSGPVGYPLIAETPMTIVPAK